MSADALPPWLDAPLAAALGATRAHPLLLAHGAQGVGQFDFALALAQAWLCEDGVAARACASCASCRLVAAHTHPDLLVLLPEALQEPLGWANADGEGTAKSERKPSKELRVEAAREAVAFAQTSSARGRAKVVVLHPAERLNAVAANTLLKTFEEPPGMARFILASAAPHALPPTVRSRCTALRLALPDAETGRRWLEAQGVASADVLLAATGGQPFAAREWFREGLDAGTWVRLPEAVQRGDASVVAGWPVPRAVEALLKLCHDAMLMRVGVPPRYFPSVPQAPALESLEAWRKALWQAARFAEQPLNAGLLVESLVAQGRRALLGERPAWLNSTA